jgi:hypothetical protein
MADALSDYLEKQILNFLKGTTFVAAPATLYVALYIATPTDADASGTEVSGGTYARKPITTSSGWSAISGGGASPNQISNAAVIDWTTTLPACTLVAWALYDAVTVGHEYWWGPLTGQPISVNAGDPTSFAIGALVVLLG